MILAALILLAPSTCARCHNPKDLPWETAIKLGAARAKEKDTTSIRKIVFRESRVNGTPSRHARNPRSSAYGYGQFIGKGPIGSLTGTWKGVGIKKTDCGVCQIEGVAYYCKYKYGSPAAAWRHWQRTKTY